MALAFIAVLLVVAVGVAVWYFVLDGDNPFSDEPAPDDAAGGAYKDMFEGIQAAHELDPFGARDPGRYDEGPIRQSDGGGKVPLTTAKKIRRRQS